VILGQIPEQIPEQILEQTPEQTPELTPEQTPGQTPEQIPGQTPGQIPEQIPELTPELTPGQIRESMTALLGLATMEAPAWMASKALPAIAQTPAFRGKPVKNPMGSYLPFMTVRAL
jgi:hypothetical protein|tara:strand:+ start:124 stop:474 length:351 start_codon:yes stop_codon:yes gene_type:complete